MSEASGKLFVCNSPHSQEILRHLQGQRRLSRCADRSVVERWLEEAQMPAERTPAIEKLLDRHRFRVEDAKLRGDTLCLWVSGEEWIFLLERLLKFGVAIQMYAVIYHEHGFTCWLGRDARKGLYSPDEELDEDDIDSSAAAMRQWLEFLPESIAASFRRELASEFRASGVDVDDEDEDEDEYEEQPVQLDAIVLANELPLDCLENSFELSRCDNYPDDEHEEYRNAFAAEAERRAGTRIEPEAFEFAGRCLLKRGENRAVMIEVWATNEAAGSWVGIAKYLSSSRPTPWLGQKPPSISLQQLAVAAYDENVNLE